LATEDAVATGPRTLAPTSPVVDAPDERRKRSRWKPTLAATIGIVIIVVVTFGAIGADVVAPYSPTAQSLRDRLQPPGPAHLFGTDNLGRDILSRTIYGARVSLVVGVTAALLAGSLGVVLGLVAGYHGGWSDAVLGRIADVQQAIPFLILAIAVAVIVGPSLTNVVLVLAVTAWVSYFRVVRAEVLTVRESLLVDAVRTLGASTSRIVVRHVLPNVSASVIVIASLMVANMIIFEASLSFLGLGVPPPTPTWGRMVFDGVQYVDSAWWLSLFPGLAIVITVMAINLVGDWLRDALDPRIQA
jgi:peptide/nickel transport system permease protein